MAYRDYILLCDYCNTYTNLNGYDIHKNEFKGEYSLLYNEYTHNNYFLNKFIITHVNHSLKLIPNLTNEYIEIITNGNYERFLEDDVDKYVGELHQQHEEMHTAMQFDRTLGQFQLNILEKMVEEELKNVKEEELKADDKSRIFINLGKEWALQWLLHAVDDITKRGDKF